jgi:biotin transport system substrate-specific component
MKQSVHASNVSNTQSTFMGFVGSVLVVLAGTALITAGAKINVPVWPVPITLQTMAVAFVSAVVGRKLGCAIVAAYLLQGALGLPVFAGGGGVTYLSGPTAGFLFAYLPMAYLIGWAAEQGARFRPLILLAAMLVADAIMMASGFAWLLVFASSTSWIDQANPVASAWRAAVEPFVVWDGLKMAVAAMLAWQAAKVSILSGRKPSGE